MLRAEQTGKEEVIFLLSTYSISRLVRNRFQVFFLWSKDIFYFFRFILITFRATVLIGVTTADQAPCFAMVLFCFPTVPL
jgi:hypothetical protein